MNALRLSALLCSLLLVTACGDGSSGPGSEHDAGPARELSFLTASPLRMPPRSTSTVTLALKDAAGRALPGVRVQLGMLGEAPGASLSALAVRTDQKGRAQVSLRAGSDAARFRLWARADGAEIADLKVEVEAILLARLDIEARYRGQRKLATRTLTAIAGARCREALGEGSIGDFVQTIASPKTNATFDLDPRSPYAVVVWGRDASGALLARGCAETEGTLSDVYGKQGGHLTVVLEDHLMSLASSYQGTFDLDVSASAARLGGFARAQAATLLPATTEPDADYVLNAIEQRLRDLGNTAAADQLAQARANDSLATALGGALDADSAGGSFVIERIAAMFEAQSTELSLVAELSGPTLIATPTALTAGSASAMSAWALPPAFVSGFALEIKATLLPDTAQLELERVGLSLALGTYAQTLLGVLLDDTALALDAQLTQDMGCDVVARWAKSQAVINGSCSQSCVNAACADAFDTLKTQLSNAFTTLDASYAELTYAGTLSMFDRDEDTLVDALSTDPLAGGWGQDAASCVVMLGVPGAP